MKPSVLDRLWKLNTFLASKRQLEEMLGMAVFENKPWRVDFLVSEKKVNPRYDNDHPFHAAILCANTELADYFIAKGADVNREDGYAISLAAANNKIGMVDFLISKGADIGANNYGALKLAAKGGHEGMIEHLWSKKAPSSSQIIDAASYARDGGFPALAEKLKTRAQSMNAPQQAAPKSAP